MIPQHRTVAAVLSLSALVLAACTASPSGSGAPAQVPTLPATSTASVAGTASADPGRPRERIDMTNTEINALWHEYAQCLAANGYDKARNGADQVAMTKAQAACQDKQPLPPWQLDANNPKGADFVHAVVQCLRGKGIAYVNEEAPQGGRWTFSFGGANSDQSSITKGLEYTPDCEKQVAAQGIGS